VFHAVRNGLVHHPAAASTHYTFMKITLPSHYVLLCGLYVPKIIKFYNHIPLLQAKNDRWYIAQFGLPSTIPYFCDAYYTHVICCCYHSNSLWFYCTCKHVNLSCASYLLIYLLMSCAVLQGLRGAHIRRTSTTRRHYLQTPSTGDSENEWRARPPSCDECNSQTININQLVIYTGCQ